MPSDPDWNRSNGTKWDDRSLNSPLFGDAKAVYATYEKWHSPVEGCDAME